MKQHYISIAQVIYGCLPQGGWTTAEYIYQAINSYSFETGRYEDKAGNTKGIDGELDSISDEFHKLRMEMAAQHKNGHAWYTAIVTITSDGKFKFDFDYDSLPAFDVAPSPDRFIREFQQFPRPELQAQVQDWMDSQPSQKDFEKMAARLKNLNKTKTMFSYD